MLFTQVSGHSRATGNAVEGLAVGMDDYPASGAARDADRPFAA